MTELFFRLLKPQWETASRYDGTFFQGIDATMGDKIYNEDTFLQGTEATMGDCHL